MLSALSLQNSLSKSNLDHTTVDPELIFLTHENINIQEVLNHLSPESIKLIYSLTPVLSVYDYDFQDILNLIKKCNYDKKCIEEEVRLICLERRGHEQSDWQVASRRKTQTAKTECTKSNQKLQKRPNRQKKSKIVAPTPELNQKKMLRGKTSAVPDVLDEGDDSTRFPKNRTDDKPQVFRSKSTKENKISPEVKVTSNVIVQNSPDSDNENEVKVAHRVKNPAQSITSLPVPTNSEVSEDLIKSTSKENRITYGSTNPSYQITMEPQQILRNQTTALPPSSITSEQKKDGSDVVLPGIINDSNEDVLFYQYKEVGAAAPRQEVSFGAFKLDPQIAKPIISFGSRSKPNITHVADSSSHLKSVESSIKQENIPPPGLVLSHGTSPNSTEMAYMPTSHQHSKKMLYDQLTDPELNEQQEHASNWANEASIPYKHREASHQRYPYKLARQEHDLTLCGLPEQLVRPSTFQCEITEEPRGTNPGLARVAEVESLSYVAHKSSRPNVDNEHEQKYVPTLSGTIQMQKKSSELQNAYTNTTDSSYGMVPSKIASCERLSTDQDESMYHERYWYQQTPTLHYKENINTPHLKESSSPPVAVSNSSHASSQRIVNTPSSTQGFPRQHHLQQQQDHHQHLQQHQQHHPQQHHQHQQQQLQSQQDYLNKGRFTQGHEQAIYDQSRQNQYVPQTKYSQARLLSDYRQTQNISSRGLATGQYISNGQYHVSNPQAVRKATDEQLQQPQHHRVSSTGDPTQSNQPSNELPYSQPRYKRENGQSVASKYSAQVSSDSYSTYNAAVSPDELANVVPSLQGRQSSNVQSSSAQQNRNLVYYDGSIPTSHRGNEHGSVSNSRSTSTANFSHLTPSNSTGYSYDPPTSGDYNVLVQTNSYRPVHSQPRTNALYNTTYYRNSYYNNAPSNSGHSTNASNMMAQTSVSQHYF